LVVTGRLDEDEAAEIAIDLCLQPRQDGIPAVTARLSAATLDRAAGPVRRPGYDFSRLRPGIVHLGLGAFHRAHQAAFTEDGNSGPNAETGA